MQEMQKYHLSQMWYFWAKRTVSCIGPGHRQVGIFLPMLLKAAEAREVGPLLRSPQLQTSAEWKLGLHLLLHIKVSTSG